MSSQEQPKWSSEQKYQTLYIKLSGSWLAKNSLSPEDIQTILSFKPLVQSIKIDVSQIDLWDSFLIVVLEELEQHARQRNIMIYYHALPDSAKKLLELLKEIPLLEPKKPIFYFRPLYDLGGWFMVTLNNIGETYFLFISCLRGFYRALFQHSFMRRLDLLGNTKTAGPSALIIISVVNFLIGSILAFVGAVQLRRFSADIYIANLVGIAIVREMAAVMTAIVVCGRTGGAYAAKIATMKGNEEIDALKVMGVSITEYIILPSVLALIIAMPLLYLYGCFMGILGGLIVSILMLKISIIGFLQQVFWAVPLNQFIFAIIKTISFAAFIGISSCHIGIKSGRSAADVGISATKAVVSGIVGVIAIDSFYAVIADIIGI